MDDSKPTRIPTPGRRISRRQVAMVAATWAAVVASALGVAVALNSTPARPSPVSASPKGLPALFLYLDRSLPAEVASLRDVTAQIARLQALATSTNDPARWVELGAVTQQIGDLGSAKPAFERALKREPDRLDAQIGLIMNDGATGPEGLTRAAKALTDLAPRYPKSQLLAFNTGMIAIYRSDGAVITNAFGRVASLGPTTQLGILAKRFDGELTPSSASP